MFSFYYTPRSTLFLLFVLLTALFSSNPAFAHSEDITLVARDGYKIAATLTRPDDKKTPATAVVLLHMYRHDKESWHPLVEKLSSYGISSLAIDMRGHGRSRTTPDGTDGHTKVLARDPLFFNSMYLDAEAAVAYLTKTLNVRLNKIALIGASVGCSVAIRSALENPVAAVVVMTPGRDYLGIPTIDHIKKWQSTPLLILTSREEADKGANDIYTSLKNKGAELKVFDETDIHGTYMFGEVENVEKIIAEWLEKQLAQ